MPVEMDSLQRTVDANGAAEIDAGGIVRQGLRFHIKGLRKQLLIFFNQCVGLVVEPTEFLPKRPSLPLLLRGFAEMKSCDALSRRLLCAGIIQMVCRKQFGVSDQALYARIAIASL